MGHKPRIVESPSVRLIELKSASTAYFIVASVEVGNTTTKCILTATNLEDGKTRLINKIVTMTRDVRAPKTGEEIFGRTLSGVELTRQSIAELVRDTLLKAVDSANLDIKTDIHFVVRSTGVVAGFDAPEEVGEFIKALADGCLMAGVPPNRMTPPMSVFNMHEKFRKYTKLEKVVFDGAVASVTPPKGATGVEIVANEMEGELATAGIKEGAKWVDVDFRNPCISMDFGTTLDGRIIGQELPYARTIGNFCGYAGAIPDALIKGTGKVDAKKGTALEIAQNISLGKVSLMLKGKQIKEYSEKIQQYIRIEKVPSGFKRYGSVPVNPQAAEEIGVVLIGCDVGINGSDMDKLMAIGAEINEKHGLNFLFAVIDDVMARVVQRLVKVAQEHGLIFENTAIGVTGRAAITGNKPKLILKYLEELGLNHKIEENVVFVDDGLARGAAVMARCMNSLGTTFNPLGGRRGGKCILAQRVKLQSGK
ncbi:putative methanogenesis marker protein 14 [Methanomethylovorans hollandica DSM 15978]|uniref:Putative methanogenesis marker protein 14 n=1 Tax=Methanomethylovorans hollandica (strain DSM 15978 / NBRC 107637 / DMS1) TaxID=867904 RepID=L0KYZ2_METHD|nr:methanogenesis marker 14 protein [Methanomethylovorans hollandica]AGB49905.1 putative methanogenesis marker protein 14 [Methanomethylovorans hollandica DSM 15978]